MTTLYVKLAKKVSTYRIGGKLYEANKVYAVDEALGETLLVKTDDKGNPYFRRAKKSEQGEAVKALRSDGRTSLRSQAPVAADDEEEGDEEEEEEEDEDDASTLGEGQGDLTSADVAPKADAPAVKKAATKKAAKKTVRLKGGKVTPAEGDEGDEGDDEGDDAVTV